MGASLARGYMLQFCASCVALLCLLLAFLTAATLTGWLVRRAGRPPGTLAGWLPVGVTPPCPKEAG